jgi:hypothetical protein
MSWSFVTWTGWVALAVAAVVAEAAARVRNGRIPTFGAFVRVVVRAPGGRWVLLVAWAWLGVHVFAR